MDRRTLSKNIAIECGNLVMQNYGKLHKLDYHTITNFAIETDRISDSLAHKLIRKHFPNDQIYSEETPSKLASSGVQWICDPLDGTIPFSLMIHDLFSVSVGVAVDRTPIIGSVYAPQRETLYEGEKCKGAYCNGTRVSVSTETDLNKVVMGIDGGKESATFKRQELAPYYHALYAQDGVTCLLGFGSAAVPLSLVASGNLHAYLALSFGPEDMTAAAVINREAGAKVTNLQGEEWNVGDKSIVTANPVLHSKLLEFLEERVN